jgi:eukaryotic-like serine/threonine-protein kinase
MEPESWRKIEEMYHAALEREAEQRAAFLKVACGSDEALRQEVESLLAQKGDGSFLESPAIEVAARALAKAQARNRTPDGRMIGRTISHYRVLEKLGEGGMGVVYKARDERLDRDVALKILPAGTLADETARSRFRREALTLSQLNHPNIAVVYDFDTENGMDFLAMEYVLGETLAAKVAAGPLPERDVIAIGTQIAEALEEAHEHDIIHRDLKPGNVMMTPKGRLKVLDFGLAKLAKPLEVDAATGSLAETQAGAVMGTVPYMAPEQLQGKSVDARADIYAMGAVLYEMVTGRRPFPEGQTSQLIAAILTQPPKPPRELDGRISSGLEAIILKALEKDPGQRYHSATDVLKELGQASVRGSGAGAQGPVTTRRWAAAAIAAAGLLMALAILVSLNVAGLRDRLRPPTGPATPRIQSLAVLPLANLSGDPEQEYFAEGMTEELIATLGRLSALRVISRTSVMRFKKTDKPLLQIAGELNVDGIVEGSVLRSGNRVRITAQLIQASTEKHLWAETYDRDLRDVLTLQSEVAQAITREIRIAVTPDEQARLSSVRPVNPEAYEAYLKGRHLDFLDNAKAVEFHQRAMQIDPAWAPPYAAIVTPTLVLGLPPTEACAKARAAAGKALELDDTLSEAHSAMAQVKLDCDWDWAGTEREFKRSLELDPSNSKAHHFYSHYLLAMRRFDQSLIESKRALELDPLSELLNTHLAWHYVWAHQPDPAIEQCRKTLEVFPNSWQGHTFRMWAYEMKGKYEDAIGDELDSKMAVRLKRAYGRFGARGYWQSRLDSALEQTKRGYVSPLDITIFYGHLGHRDEAFAWLERAYDERSVWMAQLSCDPRLDPLRSDPRFQELLRRMNLRP